MSQTVTYKLKQQPEDFQVEELTDVVPTTGRCTLYRLEKRGWATPDALAAIRRRWGIQPQRMSYGGLKDRHALTVQHLTILNGPERNLTHQGIRVEYLGRVPAPFTSADIRANRFRITLRSMTAEGAGHVRSQTEEMARQGVPNYFDDQRFGSVSEGEFVGKRLVEGRFEDALKQALTAPYEHDRGPQKAEKASLEKHWGDWPACKEKLPRSHARSLVDYLIHHPSDFRGAVVRLRPELRGLYLSAYQSHLWNRMLARWLREHCRPTQFLPVTLRLGDVPMFRDLDEAQITALRALMLPLPSARLRLAKDDPHAALITDVLAEEGLELNRMKVPGVRELFFSRGERAGLCIPMEMGCEPAADDAHPGKEKVTLSFDLPRGSYATLIVKRVTTVDA